jgi:hypothetical protein
MSVSLTNFAGLFVPENFQEEKGHDKFVFSTMLEYNERFAVPFIIDLMKKSLKFLCRGFSICVLLD